MVMEPLMSEVLWDGVLNRISTRMDTDKMPKADTLEDRYSYPHHLFRQSGKTQIHTTQSRP